MLSELSPYVESQQFTLVLFIIYIICVIYRQHNVISAIMSCIKSDKIAGVGTILISGVMPIPGRIVLCSSILKSINIKKDTNTAIASYIGTHHYYLWSPIEKSVVITIAGLGITYIQFIQAIWVPLCVYIIAMVVFLSKVNITRPRGNYTTILKSSWLDVSLLIVSLLISCIYPVIVQSLAIYVIYLTFKYRVKLNILREVDWKTICLVFVVLIAGTFVKQNHDILNNIIMSTDLLFTALFFSFIASYCLGSSSKFAGVCLLTTSIFGLQYLGLFYVVDFCGYMLSPCHKCRTITQSVHGLSSNMFRRKIGFLGIVMLLSTCLYTWYMS